jgi:hypothetical protein
LKYLLILLVIALALAPLTHFLPSKRQRLIAKMREYAAVHGLFVEFRDLPSRATQQGREERKQQIIYYGRRLPPSRKDARSRTAWACEDGNWLSLAERTAVPAALEQMPATILAASLDEGSCGIYWLEVGDEADVKQIVSALEAWQGQL